MNTDIDKSLEPMTVDEVAELLWDEYCTLVITPLVAMCDLWDDLRLGNLYPFVKDEYGIEWETLMKAISQLTLSMKENTCRTSPLALIRTDSE